MFTPWLLYYFNKIKKDVCQHLLFTNNYWINKETYTYYIMVRIKTYFATVIMVW